MHAESVPGVQPSAENSNLFNWISDNDISQNGHRVGSWDIIERRFREQGKGVLIIS